MFMFFFAAVPPLSDNAYHDLKKCVMLDVVQTQQDWSNTRICSLIELWVWFDRTAPIFDFTKTHLFTFTAAGERVPEKWG